jgi:hypothetical protein
MFSHCALFSEQFKIDSMSTSDINLYSRVRFTVCDICGHSKLTSSSGFSRCHRIHMAYLNMASCLQQILQHAVLMWHPVFYLTHVKCMRSEVVTAVTMWYTIFWYLTPCSPIELYKKFSENALPQSAVWSCLACYLNLQRRPYVTAKRQWISTKLYGVTSR